MPELLPFTARYKKPLWLAICSNTAQTAVYSAFGELMADKASDELVSFGIEHFVSCQQWLDVTGRYRPRDLATWMNPARVDRCCYLFALRDMETPTAAVLATPDL